MIFLGAAINIFPVARDGALWKKLCPSHEACSAASSPETPTSVLDHSGSVSGLARPPTVARQIDDGSAPQTTLTSLHHKTACVVLLPMCLPSSPCSLLTFGPRADGAGLAAPQNRVGSSSCRASLVESVSLRDPPNPPDRSSRTHAALFTQCTCTTLCTARRVTARTAVPSYLSWSIPRRGAQSGVDVCTFRDNLAFEF